MDKGFSVIPPFFYVLASDVCVCITRYYFTYFAVYGKDLFDGHKKKNKKRTKIDYVNLRLSDVTNKLRN